MTSTVLDVTVLLLCVSASVVALGAADRDRGAVGPEASEVGDLIATETVTVTYASAEAPNGTRTVHATHAELLALVAAEDGGDRGENAPREAFESEALAAIDRRIGPRTRIDAEVELKGSDGPADETEGASEAASIDAVTGSPRRAPNRSAAPIGPRRWRFGSDGFVRDPAGAIGRGVPWRLDRKEFGDRSSETKVSTAESELPKPITVGSDPPRGADVTATVITQPAPNDSKPVETVRIVIRRW